VQIPAQLWRDIQRALHQALGRIEALDPDPAVVTKQVYEFGQKVLAEAKRQDETSRRVTA
jgi:hypothetical protein